MRLPHDRTRPAVVDVSGCGVGLDMHPLELKATGEPHERIPMVGVWREAPCFSQAERAALALTEAGVVAISGTNTGKAYPLQDSNL